MRRTRLHCLLGIEAGLHSERRACVPGACDHAEAADVRQGKTSQPMGLGPAVQAAGTCQ